MKNTDWITTDEAAEILGIPTHRVRYRILRGDLVPVYPQPEYRGHSVQIYLSRADCERMADRWRKPARPEFVIQPDWISLTDAARLLGLNPGTFRSRVDKGKIQPVSPHRGTGHLLYFSRPQIEALRAEWEAIGLAEEPPDDPDLIPVSEAAQILGLTPSGFRRHIDEGNLAAHRVRPLGSKYATQLLLSRSEVEAFRDRGIPPAELAPYAKSPTRDDIIYFAGLFDGEGSVVIHHGRPGRRSVSGQYCLRVSLANTDTDLIQWITETFGGSVQRNKPQKPGYRPVHHWVMVSASGYHVLKLILTFVRVKKAQVQLGIEFQEQILRYNGRNRGLLEPAEVEQRENLRRQMLKLNARGKFYPEAPLDL